VAVIGVDVKPDGVLVTIVGGDALNAAELRAELAAALPDTSIAVQQIDSTVVWDEPPPFPITGG
jgi:hypothetical protein